jgi:phage/plasmid-associated DNA primase
MSGVFGALKCEFNIYDDIFDNNPNLVCFQNGTYDLENNIFRESKKEDYITKCISYDFTIISDDDPRMLKCEEFLRKVMPEDDKRDLLLTCLATSLRSITLEKFIVLTGNGRNGKDTLITYLMKNTLCESGFYYETNANVITGDSKSELNVALNNCHKKNMIVINEPASNKKIICNQVKHITGGSNVNARGLYSSVTETKINCSLFMLCNDMPLLDNPDDAMLMRLLVFKFNTTFKSKEELEEMGVMSEGLHEDGLYYYYVDEYYKSKEFVDECKLAMMNILLRHYSFYRLNKYIIKNNVKSVIEENKKYINNSCDFMSWFNSTYKFTENENDYIKLSDVHEEYIKSYLYENLNKADKRKNNKQWLFDKIRFSPFLRKYYCERKRFGDKFYRNILLCCVEKSTDDSDTEDECKAEEYIV